MSATFDAIKALVKNDKILVSQHAFKRLTKHAIKSDDLIAGLATAVLIEDYSTYYSGPAILVLSSSRDGRPLHSVWGLEKGTTEPAVLITTYRPDPARWNLDNRTRRP